jgi:hypothetical protein
MTSKLKLVKNFPNRAFAEQAVEILERQNISAILKGNDVGILGTSSSAISGGINLYVEEKHQAKAAEYLNALYDGI